MTVGLFDSKSQLGYAPAPARDTACSFAAITPRQLLGASPVFQSGFYLIVLDIMSRAQSSKGRQRQASRESPRAYRAA